MTTTPREAVHTDHPLRHVTVDAEGVHFGPNYWVSHETITGCVAELIPQHHPQYLEWAKKMLDSTANDALADLRHDLERYQQITTAQATEITEANAALAEARAKSEELTKVVKLYRASHNFCIRGEPQGLCNKCTAAEKALRVHP